MAMLELLQGMGFGEDLTVHGFRSTFKDWCSEQTAYPNEMSEMALAHAVSDKVEATDCASAPTAKKGNVVRLRA